MHHALILTLLVLLIGMVSSDPCSKSCDLPLVLYETTCVCLPTYVKQSCIKGDKDRCPRVISAGLCGTVTYAAACASGCGLCDADYVKPTGPQVFFPPDSSARELFDVDCGSPSGLGDGTVAPTSTTFTSIARYTCNPGYLMDGHGLSKCQHDGSWSSLATVCNDIDECATNTDNCHAAARCTNNPGSFSCACHVGYSGNGVICADIDECATNTDNCHAAARCTNNPGSFSCACHVGYSGNGVICADINECITNAHNCHVSGATCSNTPGSFTCACNPGYTGNGVSCSDVNECNDGHDCHANAECTNNPGSFSCACNPGYSGNGRSCTDLCPTAGGYVSVAVPRLCFKLSASGDTRNWAQSRSDCQGQGGRLIILNSADKHNYITQYLNTDYSNAYYSVWVGMTQVSPGEYRWTDGSTDITQWAEREPDNVSYQNCGKIIPSGLSDVECEDTNRYLCEIPFS